MYSQFFNLREMPFNITPDPAYLYLSPRHQEALGHLLYGTGQYGGFVQLTGEVGTGKTTVVRTLLEQKLVDVDVAMIHNPRQNEVEFVQSICDELGVDYERADITLKLLVDALNAHLLRTHAAGRRTVLIIDEAQNLPRDVLEQVRLLTNLETHKEKLLRIMLIGQPELSELLARPDLRQLASRITARYHLMPLTQNETGDYIRHRLRVAGTHEDLFPAAAVQEIHRHSRGVPRLINILCDRALLGAYGLGQRRVTPDIVRKAAAESLGSSVDLEQKAKRWALPMLRDLRQRPLLWIEGVLAVIAIAVAAALLYETISNREAADEPEPPTALAATEPEPAAAVPASVAAPVMPIEESAPAVAAAAEAAPAPPLSDLTTLLQRAQPLPEVVGRLIRLWDRTLVIPRGANVCRELSLKGLECLRASGEWSDLASIDRPAILSLTTGRGELVHVLLTRLTSKLATVDDPSGPLLIPVDQLDSLWTGEYLALWRRETPVTRVGPGERGPAVVWLRQRLAQLRGEAVAEPPSDLYDAPLIEEVRRFQTERGLQPDGVLGFRTLIELGDREPGTPRLSEDAT